MALILIGELQESELALTHPSGKELTLQLGQSVEMGRGSLEFNGAPEIGFFVIRRSGSGNVNYPQTIDGDSAWKFGPYRAHRVVDPANEKNPILKVLRTYNIPVGRFRRIESEETFVEIYEDDRDAYDFRYDKVFGDYKEYEYLTRQEDGSGDRCLVRFTGASVLVSVWVLRDCFQRDIYRPNPNDHLWHAEIRRVYVGRDVTPEAVEDYLRRAMTWANERLGRQAFSEVI